MNTVVINARQIRIDFIGENLETENTKKASVPFTLCINQMIKKILQGRLPLKKEK
jgi:predicted HAD superfamily phosphohydrolase YqeG